MGLVVRDRLRAGVGSTLYQMFRAAAATLFQVPWVGLKRYRRIEATSVRARSLGYVPRLRVFRFRRQAIARPVVKDATKIAKVHVVRAYLANRAQVFYVRVLVDQ